MNKRICDLQTGDYLYLLNDEDFFEKDIWKTCVTRRKGNKAEETIISFSGPSCNINTTVYGNTLSYLKLNILGTEFKYFTYIPKNHVKNNVKKKLLELKKELKNFQKLYERIS